MPDKSASNTRSVFVVHGRDEALRNSMFEFLRSIDLSPMEWTQAVASTGLGSPYIGQVLDSAFEHAQAIVVLLTPDEVAYLQPRHGNGPDDPETRPAAQSRPNVLFEAGMALGRDPDRTIMVEVGDVRPFSDVAGRHLVRLNNASESRQALAQRLATAGCEVDMRGTDWHTAGDFSAPPLPGDGLPLGRRVPSSLNSRRALDFDAQYIDKGGNRIGRLQITNRGTEAAYDVIVSVPADATLALMAESEIEKIPGGGKSVRIDAMDGRGHRDRRDARKSFDITVEGRTDSGEVLKQEVFIDMNR